jgi:uncharacterized protein YcaQ
LVIAQREIALPKISLPTPSLTITKKDARRFMLAHHGLFSPRRLMGKTGILEYIRHVGSIQFDPINIVGRNPDLVLQSRVLDYRSNLLDELLYEDRKLVDGWDKMAAIYCMEDWPNFSRRRGLMNQPGIDSRRPSNEVLAEVLLEVRERGPVSSLDFSETPIVDWHWGPTKAARAALESLFSMGNVGVHHRVNNRRAFDLIHRLVPPELLDLPDPFVLDEDYQDWHFLRRVGGMGLVTSKSGEYWYGIQGVMSKERQGIIRRLTDTGKIIAVGIDEIPNQTFFIRNCDHPTLKAVLQSEKPENCAAIIAALDNLIWNRGLIEQVFDFSYIWEVYKPKSKRKFGYYVLPVVYGDQFIARFEPKYDKKKRIFTVENWWWEGEVEMDTAMYVGLRRCLKDFVTYLNADSIRLGLSIQKDSSLHWLRDIVFN